MNKKLKFLDRYLTLWIFLSMLIGISIGYFLPEFSDSIQQMGTGTTNIPLAVGLILMMYPPLVKVNFARIPALFKNVKLLSLSLLITWIVGPFLMFGLATLLLHDYPEYMQGLIIIGIAPCIAMVIVWNELASGNREYVAGLVGINSLLQVAFFSLYAYFFLEIMLPWVGLEAQSVNITIAEIAKTVGIYLGIPFLLGVISRYGLIAWKGSQWFHTKFVPFISPLTLVALLLTIVLMFSFKGQAMVALPMDVLKVTFPLLIFFLVMFFLTFFIMKKAGADYAENAAISFTASGNNFELAIAVSIGIFGIESGQAFAGVIGPLVEVPVLILLVQAAYGLKKKCYPTKN